MAAVPVRPSKAPRLPNASEVYTLSYINNLNNVLRLYFNEIDNFTNVMLSSGGGAYLSLPHIAASDSTDQYAAADNTPTKVLWDTLDSGYGFTLNPSGSATAAYSGVYKIDFSLQFANTNNAQHDVAVWLRVDGNNVARSTTKFSLPQRKSAGVFTFICAYSSVVFEITAGQDIELYWATDKAYNPTGPVDGIYMEFQAAQTVPYARPSVPSAIGSITFVSRTNT